MQDPAITLAIDNVLPLTRSDYDADRQAMVAALRAAGACAIYEIGKVAAPGISDLDLVACFPDGADLRQGRESVVAALRECSRTFLHPPWAMYERHRQLLPSLFAVRQYAELLGGGELMQQQTPAQRTMWNLEAIACVLAILRGRRRISTRSALCLLNGIRYNLELAREDGLQVNDRSLFATRITALRSDWFALAPEQRTAELLALWSAATPLLRDLLAGYADRCGGWFVGAAPELLLRLPGTGTTCCFTSAATPHRVLSQPLARLVALPPALGPVFARFAAAEGGLAGWLRLDRATPGQVPALAEPWATSILDYARDHATYLGDVLAQPHPYLLLGGGTLSHVRTKPWTRIAAWVQRAGSHLTRVATKALHPA